MLGDDLHDAERPYNREADLIRQIDDLRRVARTAADTLADVANSLKDQLDAGEGVLESSWLDPLMSVHGVLIEAGGPPSSDGETDG